MIEWLVTPLSYTFMQRGLFAAIIVGVVCSIIGCFVVLRSMAFLGDAMAHAILPGIAVAYLIGGSLTVGALVAAVAVALGIGFLSKQGTIKEDTAIGILFTAALAIGIALISTIRTYAVDLTHILFGNMLGVNKIDLILTAIIGSLIIITIIIFYRELLLISFDPIFAITIRLKAEFYRYLLLIIIALTIVISIQTVGVVLVAAMLVTPGATAYLLVKRLHFMMLISAGIGIISSFAGLYISYYANIASGASIVLTATGIFVLVFLFSPRRGIIWNLFKQKRARSI